MPPICTAVRLPFVRQYAPHLYGSTFGKVLGVGVTGTFLKKLLRTPPPPCSCCMDLLQETALLELCRTVTETGHLAREAKFKVEEKRRPSQKYNFL